MSTYEIIRNHIMAVCAVIVFTAVMHSRPTSAATIDWQVTSGDKPNQIINPFNEGLSGAASSPTLGVDGLLISTTSPVTNNAFYSQQSDQVDFVGAHSISFDLKVNSSTSSQADRTSAGITFTTGGSAGQSLFVGIDSVFFIEAGGDGIGQSAAIDTNDDFHNYRIDISGVVAGSQVSLFVDNVLTLQDVILSSAANFGTSERIVFGEFSSGAYGDSTWKSFTHDAGVAPVPVPAALPLFLSGLLGLGVVARRRKKASA